MLSVVEEQDCGGAPRLQMHHSGGLSQACTLAAAPDSLAWKVHFSNLAAKRRGGMQHELARACTWSCAVGSIS